MLTKAESYYRLSDDGRRIIPDRITKNIHAHYPGIAAEMLAIYSGGIGSPRGDLHAEIRKLFQGEENFPVKRGKAFCKLLDDASDYEEARGGKVADLRIRVFSLAAEKHPLVRKKSIMFAHDEETVKKEIAETIGRPWSEIEEELFSDVYELQRLKKFKGYASELALLSRYNEAQLQAALYGATQMQVIAKRDYRTIVMAAKRAMLMHEAERLPDNSFKFTFYGPASPLRVTRRYGVLFARMIPDILTCKDWEMVAKLNYYRKGKQPLLIVNSESKYTSSAKAAPEYDSALERDFAEKWGSEPRDGWVLERESEPRFAGQKAFFPDFTFRHDDGRCILMEIVGHWTPEYLEGKRETLKHFRSEPIIFAVGEGEADSFMETGAEIVRFKTVLKIDPVLEALAKVARG